MANNNDDKSLNILLIGKTGHGKSSTGNSILGRKGFTISGGPKSGTKEVKDAWTVDGQCEIKVVDGPGLEDTDLNAVQDNEQACENMTKALMLCNGVVHAFVLVIRFPCKLTTEERKTISDLKQIFGESYLKNHGIIVITGGDQFADEMEEQETPGKTFTEWCRENDAGFGNLFKECSFRVVMFNNRSKCEEGEKRKQRKELLDHVKKLQKKGGYTSAHFKAGAELRKKLVKDSQLKILEETVQKRIDLLSAELVQLSINSSVADVDRLDARIQDLYTEIEKENLQQESMKKLTASLKSLSSTTKELRRAIEEKNTKDIQSHLARLSTCNKELKEAGQIPWSSIFAGAIIGLQVGAKLIEVGASVVPQLLAAVRFAEIAKVLFQTPYIMAVRCGSATAFAAYKDLAATGSFLPPVPTALASTGTPFLNIAMAIIQKGKLQ